MPSLRRALSVDLIPAPFVINPHPLPAPSMHHSMEPLHSLDEIATEDKNETSPIPVVVVAARSIVPSIGESHANYFSPYFSSVDGGTLYHPREEKPYNTYSIISSEYFIVHVDEPINRLPSEGTYKPRSSTKTIQNARHLQISFAHRKLSHSFALPLVCCPLPSLYIFVHTNECARGKIDLRKEGGGVEGG